MHGWMGWDHGMGGGGWLMMGVFWVLVILGVFLLARFLLDRGRSSVGRGARNTGGGAETSLDVLKSRYAAGELSREEYLRMKKDLE